MTTIQVLKSKIEEREQYLYKNQPHDDEWDCNFDQFEYFTLGLLTEEKVLPYNINLDDEKNIDNYDNLLIRNPLLDMDIEKINDVLEFISLLFETCTLKEISEKFAHKIDVYSDIVIDSLIFEIIDTAIDIINADYRSNDYFYEMSIPDVLMGSVYSLINDHELQSEEYNIWIQMHSFNKSNEFYKLDHEPCIGISGIVKAKLINNKTNIIREANIYWNEECFDIEETETVYAWKIIEKDMPNKYIEDDY